MAEYGTFCEGEEKEAFLNLKNPIKNGGKERWKT